MNEKRERARPNDGMRSFNCQQSCIDVLSKVESLFLQKFFRYNLSDYFQESLINIEQDLLIRKIKNKALRQLSAEAFLVRSHISIPRLTEQLNAFYRTEKTHTPDYFRYLYANTAPNSQQLLQQNQIAIVTVKMKADAEKIENLPCEFYRQLEQCQQQLSSLHQHEEEELVAYLRKYDKKVINLLVIYFGDTNFHLFDKRHYQPREVNFFNHTLEVRIFVFYVSKIALVEKFKKISKIQATDCINDLLIQLYEFKRERIRHKRMRHRGREYSKMRLLVNLLK